MSSAVQNLQKAIVDGGKSITQLLRQTKIIAAKLGLEDVERWVDYELNGYPEEATLPPYRGVQTDAIFVHNPLRGWEFAGNLSERIPVRHPISEIEQLSKLDSPSTPLPQSLPMRDSLGKICGQDQPQRLTTKGLQFGKILEAVTNALLQWTVELEKRGIKGENMDFSSTEQQSATSQVFNIQHFTGVLGNVVNSQVTLYDYSSVNQLLVDHGIPKQDRRELEDIMDELKEAPPEKHQSCNAAN